MKTKCSDCCYPEVFDSAACGCCEGIKAVTPLSTANRPGLSKLVYRIGTHAEFLETMLARLSNNDFPGLAGLTTRDAADPSIALLDAWATVADVLTFYQERIANEGYLRTATERRSILELARLVGYKLRPGVSASVFLAYTLDEKMKDEVIIPAGSRAQSIPGPYELPQSFETSEDLKARARWNVLKPRMTRPQTRASIEGGLRVYLKGINTNLKPNDPLLIGVDKDDPQFYRVTEVKPDAEADRTLVKFRDPVKSIDNTKKSQISFFEPVSVIRKLTLKPSLQPRNSLQLSRKLSAQFKVKSETSYASAASFSPMLGETLSMAVANAQVAPDVDIKVYALRVEASPFGHNAPPEPQYWSKDDDDKHTPGTLKPQPWDEWKPDGELANILYLDRHYDQILPGSYIVIDKKNSKTQIIVSSCKKVEAISRSAYGISGETTRITLNDKWWQPDPKKGDISDLRTTMIYAQPEELDLAEEPIKEAVCGGTDDPLELDGFYEGLKSGRWVIVSGERDVSGTSGVKDCELAMVASVTQDVSRVKDETGTVTDQPYPGEKYHTFLTLAENLQYCFKRDTVTIYGNVVKATHGETRHEVLGSGDGSRALQSFELKQFPLTHVSASNPTGVDSTLKLFVNDIQWHEADSLAGLQATDRNFITRTDNKDKITVTFGNGREGARLPTGIENIKAQYRNGIGKPGNVRAEQISLLTTKPLGVKEVINPLRASGGADRESRDQARKNTPLAVKALDRLVSVRDYEDFARVYAGIGKALAVEIPDGRHQIVHVTIAGADDIPIDETSDLFRNLRQALHDFGDPFQPILLAVRELMMIVISTRVRIQPDCHWEPVVKNLRTALLESFGFERRELGQDVLLSEVISVMQAVRGVAYVDVDAFGGIPEKVRENGERRMLTPDEIAGAVDCLSTQWSHDNMEEWCQWQTSPETECECGKYEKCKQYGNIKKTKGVRQRLRVNMAALEDGVIHPAQLAFLTPDVPETLILNRIE